MIPIAKSSDNVTKSSTHPGNTGFNHAVAIKTAGLDLFTAYGKLAHQLVELLADFERHEAEIAAANAQVAARGDARTVEGIERAYWSPRQVGAPQYPEWTLCGQIVLPDVEVARQLLWPRGAQA
jgi:hypothetical protein